MSIATITAAQRIEVRDECVRASVYMQRWAQNAKAPDATDVTESATALNAAAAALAVAGASPGGTFTTVSNGDAVTISDSSGTPALAGTATVSGGSLTGVAITATTAAIIQHADTVPVKSFAGAVVSGAPTAEVVAGTVVAVKLSSAAALAANTVKQSVGTVSGSGTFGTFTVSGGVITGIVLSAS